MNLLQAREALANALSSLQTQVRAPLEQAFEALGKLGPEAQREVNALKALKARAEATWPALACDIQTAETALSAAVKDEEQIQRSGRTVQHVRQQLDTTRQQYQAAISEAQAQQKRIRQAQDERRNALNRLARWQGQLRAYQQSHPDDPAIREAVQTRLHEITQAMRKAQRRHKKPMSSAEAAQVLQALWTLAHQDIALPGSRRTIKIKTIEKGR
jgi:chromosome segregation ATPase